MVHLSKWDGKVVYKDFSRTRLAYDTVAVHSTVLEYCTVLELDCGQLKQSGSTNGSAPCSRLPPVEVDLANQR